MRQRDTRWRQRRRGAAMVEFILLLPLLMMILMAILEFGLLANDVLIVHRACYQGAWNGGAYGKPVEEIKRLVVQLAPRGVRSEDVVIEYLPRKKDASGQEPGDWEDAANPAKWNEVGNQPGGGANNAPVGSIFRVRVKDFPHRLVTGTFFNWLPNYKPSWNIPGEGGAGDTVPVLLVNVQASQPRSN